MRKFPLPEQQVEEVPMYRLNNPRHRKPDFLMVLVTLVGIALGATLALQYYALSDGQMSNSSTLLSQNRF